MEIERLFELAMKDIEIQGKLKSDRIFDKLQEFKDHQRDVEQTLDMIKLKVQSETKQKFVKNYLGMVKDAEAQLSKDMRVEGAFESSVVDLRIKAPFFNDIISQKDHKGQLMSVSMNAARNHFGSRHQSVNLSQK